MTGTNRKKQTIGGSTSYPFAKPQLFFQDPYHIVIYDEKHSQNEDRWITLGADSSGIIRVIVHTFEQESRGACKIRIISARKANKTEVLQYQEGNV